MTRATRTGLLGICLFLTFNICSNAAPIELVSRPSQPRPSSFGDSSDLLLPAYGPWYVFTSSGSGITTNYVGDFTLNIFLKNSSTGEALLVSGRNGAGGNGHSYAAAISDDTRYIVFETEADDLVDDDTNEGTDVLLYDRTTGELSLVSGTTNGVAEGSSGAPDITPDGRFILFESDAALSELDSNDWVDLYLFDREAGEFKVVTVNSNGTAAAGSITPPVAIGSYEASISSDGRYVAFVSTATNHVPGVPANAGAQIFLRDMIGGTNVWLSRKTNSTPPTLVSSPVVSSNGAYVVFLSANLEPTSFLGGPFLYIYDIATGTRKPVRDGNTPVTVAEFSVDNQHVAFSTEDQVYLYNILSNRTTLVSVNTNGAPANGISGAPVISGNGSVLAFNSLATDLVAGVSEKFYQTYAFHDGNIYLLSRAASGSGGANGDTIFHTISGGGRVGFMSFASNLVTNDNVGFNDVFVAVYNGGLPVQLVSSPDPAAISSTPTGSSALEGQGLSADGRRLIFTSVAEDIVPNDTNGLRDIFLAALTTNSTRLISVGTNGAPLPGPTSLIGVSLDANVIAFSSSNVVNGTNTRSIFVYDARTGVSEIGNVLPTGDISQVLSDGALSPNGRYLAFRLMNIGEAYVRDLETKTTVRVTAPPLPNPSQVMGFSPEGRYLALRTGASTYALVDWASQTQKLTFTATEYLTNAFSADENLFLVPIRVTPTSSALYLVDLRAGTNSTPVGTNVLTAGISADGSTVAYLQATNASSGTHSLFTYDVITGARTALQIGGSNAVFRPRGSITLNADGRFIAFATTNSLLNVPAIREFADVYVYDRVLNTLALITESLTGTEAGAGVTGPLISADGRIVVFDTIASNLVVNDRNFNTDVFLRRIDPTDSDTDGLEDGWEMQQFGGLNATANADADNDGVSNQDEFLAGTDPNSAQSRLVMEAEMDEENATLLISSPASAGRTYQMQYRPSLGEADWQDVGSPTVAFSEEVTFEVPITLTGTGFFRVKAMH